MNEDVSKQSRFSRTLINTAKLGSYYTDTDHASRMGRMVRLGSEVCVLEPSVGDASALFSFLESTERSDETKVFTYGVELSKTAYEEVRGKLSHCLQADFTSGCVVTQNAFSLVFTNPPYGEVKVGTRTERLESRFVERIYRLMIPEGLMVLIVSYPTMQGSAFARCLLSRFSVEKIFRFDDKEYSKFQQVVIFARRRRVQGFESDELKELKGSLEVLENLPYLPKADEETDICFDVPDSYDEKVDDFHTIAFDAESAVGGLSTSSLYGILDEKVKQTEYRAVRLGAPPLPPKKDLLYILAISGGGQGLAGNEDEGTLHLQRGVAKIVTDKEAVFDDAGKQIGEKETTHTRISMCVVQQEGEQKVSWLESGAVKN